MRDPETSFIQSRKSLERKIFKVRRNVFPPILTNRAPQNLSTSNNKRSSTKHSIKDSKKVRFHVSEPSSSYSQSSGDSWFFFIILGRVGGSPFEINFSLDRDSP